MGLLPLIDAFGKDLGWSSKQSIRRAKFPRYTGVDVLKVQIPKTYNQKTEAFEWNSVKSDAAAAAVNVDVDVEADASMSYHYLEPS